MSPDGAEPDWRLPADWPAPGPDDRARQRALIALIRGEIDAGGGAIPFSRYMELALYAPGLGYYSTPLPKFGEAGDFVTAPTLSPLFAQALASQIGDVLVALDDADILEVGAGDGTLAADLLAALESQGRLPRAYCILELSASLRARQEQTLLQRAPQLLERVRWLDALPESGFRGVVFGNELLDAMPVARFAMAAGMHEQYVSWRDGRFVVTLRAPGEALRLRLAALELPDDYLSEVGLGAEAWVRSIGERLRQGMLLLCDYGFPRAEFYHPQRNRGTLMCHYRQRAHGNPFVLVGLQDVTAHVDFSAVAEAGHDVGLEVMGYTSQAAFLIGCGIAEIALPADARAQLAHTQALHKLTAPHEMGELFKVIAFGRGLDLPLRGFAVQDRRHRL